MNTEKELLTKMNEEKEALLKRHDDAILAAIQAQAAGFHLSQQKQLEEETEKIRKSYDEEFNYHLALIRHEQVKRLVNILDDIERSNASIRAFEHVAEDVLNTKQRSKELHAQSAMLLALETQMESREPLFRIVQKAKTSCGSNALVSAILAAIPVPVLHNGVPTLEDLRIRFRVVRKEVRKASLVPEYAPNFLGQLVGNALASISWSPAEGDRVSDDTAAPSDIEDHLATIAFHLDGGNLEKALKECDHIKNYPRTLMQDWEKEVKNRMIMNDFVHALKAEMMVQHLHAK